MKTFSFGLKCNHNVSDSQNQDSIPVRKPAVYVILRNVLKKKKNFSHSDKVHHKICIAGQKDKLV